MAKVPPVIINCVVCVGISYVSSPFATLELNSVGNNRHPLRVLPIARGQTGQR